MFGGKSNDDPKWTEGLYVNGPKIFNICFWKKYSGIEKAQLNNELYSVKGTKIWSAGMSIYGFCVNIVTIREVQREDKTHR